MKILVGHNFYLHPGGEDQVFRAECDLLVRMGHEVITFNRKNDEILGYSALENVTLAARTLWAWDSYADIQVLLERERPDVAHFHNLQPLISPSVYYACRRAGVPVVQTLHNYRLICPGGTLFRDGHPCEECVESSSFLPGIVHGCYRSSRLTTALVASMLSTHKVTGTWVKQVDYYIALSEFARSKLLSAGLAPKNVIVKPNFLTDPGSGTRIREYALFIGRLVPEKGITKLLNAWGKLSGPLLLRIAGDGPLREDVERAVNQSSGKIEWLGQVSRERARELVKGARFLVFPSEWYEGFPLTLVESLACGTPVIAARIGSVAEIIVDGGTGIHFTAGDEDDLLSKLQWACSHSDVMEQMGRAARKDYLEKYTPEQNYAELMAIYERARAAQRLRDKERGSDSVRHQPGQLKRKTSKPAVMLAHDFYKHYGGEDSVVEADLRMLTDAGHRTLTFFRHNSEISGNSWWGNGKLAATNVWAWDSARELRSMLRRQKPDLVHFHNLMPLLSPSLYYVCREFNIPVVQTLHNYRLLCPAATMYRDGKVCEQCLGKAIPWPGVIHKCYRQDRLATAAVGIMISTHSFIGTWKNEVDCYIALTEFARCKLLGTGIPEKKIVVKPNYVDPDPGPKQEAGDYALFVGRLSPEKGIATLLAAWRRLKTRVPLLVVGNGPSASEVSAACSESASIRWLGQIPKQQVIEMMKGARFLVLPSECYENFPLAVVEAFACALPIVASNLGAMGELVDDNHTGLHFCATNAEDLASKVEWAWLHPEDMQKLGLNARSEYEAKYTAAANYTALMEVYNTVLKVT